MARPAIPSFCNPSTSIVHRTRPCKQFHCACMGFATFIHRCITASCAAQKAEENVMGKLTVSLGNPFLILLYSLALLSLGCAIGLYWRATPGMALCLAAIGSLLMVIHDMAMGVLWFVAAAKLFKAEQNGPR